MSAADTRAWLESIPAGVARRFMAAATSVNPATGCVLWRGATAADGYGSFTPSRSIGSVGAHRVAFALSGQTVPPGMELDHACRNRLCVNPEHLRAATRQQNCANTGPRPGTSSFKGVSVHRASGKWQASIRVNGKQRGLGLYATQEAAAVAYNEAARLHFGEFAYLNEVAA